LSQGNPSLPGLCRTFDITKAVAKLQGMVAMSARLANAFRANVRGRMAALGLSQDALAKRMKVTPAFVSQMLSGHRNPGLNSLEDFAKALEIDASELISDKVARKMAKAS
jgi:predicted transcriptional regulator